MNEWSAIGVYFTLVLLLGLWASRRVKTASDFNLGNRSLGFVLTAMAAHASDMSSWLFMGYPAIIFTGGIFQAWVGLGLLAFMWLNWTLIAPKIRQETEDLNCSTLSSFFEKKLGDETRLLRLVSTGFCCLFYTVYISAGLVGLGVLGETLLQIDYFWGITLGIGFVFAYLSLGGYVALAWSDLVQGLFLLFVILGVPAYLFFYVEGLTNAAVDYGSFLPDSWNSGWTMLTLMLGWGLGYFGQPHILTKFMGIQHVNEMHKSRNVGMSWMMLSLFGATCVGLIGISFFPKGLPDSETVFIEMCKQISHPFLTGLILSAVIAATINVVSSQLLVMSTTLTEDLLFQRKAFSEKEKLLMSRCSILLIASLAYANAYFNSGSIFSLVHYAWAGLGASFGPLILALLFTKKVTRNGALTGLLIGGGTAAIWPLCAPYLFFSLDPLILSYTLGLGSIVTISKFAPENALEATLSLEN